MRIFKAKKMQHSGTDLQLFIQQYTNARIGLQFMCKCEEYEGLEPYMTASVNLPDAPCGPNEVYIKNWSENEGIEELLIKWEVIEPTPVGCQPSGYVVAPLYRFTTQAMTEIALVLLAGKKVRK